MTTLTCSWARLPSIAPIVTTLSWPAPAYIYLEHIPAAWLTPAACQTGIRLDVYDPQTPFDDWGRGRIFGETGELRWEYSDGQFHAVYCGDTPPAGFTSEALSIASSKDTAYYLWGIRVAQPGPHWFGLPAGTAAYIESRIPRILSYPDLKTASSSSGRNRLRVRVHEWYGADGALVYARWYGLEVAE
jgi:hypothetical protein